MISTSEETSSKIPPQENTGAETNSLFKKISSADAEALKEIQRQRDAAKNGAFEDQIKIQKDQTLKLWFCGPPVLTPIDFRKGDARKIPAQPSDLTRVWRYKVIVLENADGTVNTTPKEVNFDVTSKKLLDKITRQMLKPQPQQRLAITRRYEGLGTDYDVEPC